MPTLHKELVLDCPREALWQFHSDPEPALPKLTPPGKRVKIIRIDRPYGEGSHVVLKTRVMPLIWVTMDVVIDVFEPPERFVDVQVRGPFKHWRHEHRFEVIDDTHCRLVDHVEYSTPMGPIGRIVEKLFINRDIEQMFDYRHKVTEQALAASP